MESPIETWEETIFYRLPGSNKVQGNATLIGPCLHHSPAEFAAVVYGNRLRRGAMLKDSIQAPSHFFPCQRLIHQQEGTLPCVLVNDGQHPKPAAIEQPGTRALKKSILHRSCGFPWGFPRNTGPRDSSSLLGAHQETFRRIERINGRGVHPPALSAEQYR